MWQRSASNSRFESCESIWQEKWKIDFSRSFFVGDSIVDRDCAKNANIPFILVSRSHNKELNYHRKIDSLNQIKEIVKDKIWLKKIN